MLDAEFDRLLDLEQTERGERLVALARRCPRLTEWLLPLLAAVSEQSDQIDAIMASAADCAVASLDAPAAPLAPGTRLGAWELSELVGSGGMGTVYRARRADGAFDMDAAVKLIRVRHHRHLARRLELERQLLARLDHPNIARILDGASTDDGQAYLVMEWVAGSDLGHCKERFQGRHQRCLELFMPVAEAVNHAHQRRVVHGDIKPANLRLGEDGRIRLLDFGVARLLAEESTETDSSIRALTPAFSAPELHRGEPASTQSDVWALGALLYWMISGHKLPKPDATTAVDHLSAMLKGRCPRHRDLAEIMAMATAADPDRRYPGVAGLIKDLQRYQAGQPVLAHPATRRYLISRFVRRNPVTVGLGSISVCLLVIGLMGTAWQAHLAGLERDRAELERDRARLEAARTERVGEFLVELFEQADPHRALGEDLSARELVQQGSERIERLEEAPLVQAAMYQVLARVNRSLAEHETAHRMAGQALAILEGHPLTRREELAEAWTLKGATLSSLGRYLEAEQAHRRALALTDSHDRPAVARALNNIGLALYSLGRFDQAEVMLTEALDIQQGEHVDGAALASAYNNLALVLAATGRRDQAEPLYRQALELRRIELGDRHPATSYSLTNLAALLVQRGLWDEAEQAFLEALDARRYIYGDRHPAVASVLYQIGWLHSQRGAFDQALDYYEDALAIRRAMLGDDHPSVAVMLNALGQIAREQNELGQARQWLEQALVSYRRAYGESHHDIALVMTNLGATRMEQGELEQAEQLLIDALAMNRSELGETHEHVADNLGLLARLYLEREQPEQALEHARRAGAVLRALHGEDDHPAKRANRALMTRIDLNMAAHEG